MYSNETIAAAISRWQKNPAERQLPDIPNVNTVAGRVVMLCIEDFIRQESTTRMERLIDANQEVRQAFSAKRG
jgi:hypothetical protein